MNLLKNQGFAEYNLDAELNPTKEDIKEIQKEFQTLPPDPYAKGLNRYRRYGRAIIVPGQSKVQWLPTVDIDNETYFEYFQGEFNPEYKDEVRRFHAVSNSMMLNNLLNEIILFDYQQTFWNERDILLPVHVGIHFVKLLVENENEKAISSPNSLHQDGEPFTFAHLIKRENVLGGVNVIGEPEASGNLPENVDSGLIRKQFYLENILESYGVFDPLVSHYAGPVERGAASHPGERSVILIDFQPTVVAQTSQTSQNIDLEDMVSI